ncbi:oxidoreductase [Amycolatopsis carbonis]|uniref:Oxidoreductase n=1 Tax=Amycolatopsis carbonis TaxID=715471 RepID=A0A9Y2N055_9PSEU|nr:oxidoreductase [Amycolatopsis sp. 2-15]WIX81627.1 oxidoreductase [Amycolatopsis sp. 2-15]
MDSRELLTDAPVPPVAVDVGWLRAMVARFSSGEDHATRRKLVIEELANVEPRALREAAAARPHQGPVATLAEVLGFEVDPADVAKVAKAYQPHFSQSTEADEACQRLVEALGQPDERTAAKVGLLVQAAATESLIKNTPGPPVPSTRRWVDGAEVAVDLTDFPFGTGPHACPGEAHAEALAEGALSSTHP